MIKYEVVQFRVGSYCIKHKKTGLLVMGCDLKVKTYTNRKDAQKMCDIKNFRY